MDELQHECGIAAIYHLDRPPHTSLAPKAGPEQVSRLMPRMLLDLQNRGDAADAARLAEPRPTGSGVHNL
jgi:amidophosphoribosyltransferase